METDRLSTVTHCPWVGESIHNGTAAYCIRKSAYLSCLGHVPQEVVMCGRCVPVSQPLSDHAGGELVNVHVCHPPQVTDE